MTPARRAGRDLVVIGGGSAGLVAAALAARLGAGVLLVEKERLGGDCTWTGCVPSKALLHIAGLAQQLRAALELGLHPAPRVDFAKVMGRVRHSIEAVYAFETPERLREAGVEVEFGAARFLDPWTVEAGGRRISGRRFLVCTGAVPALPPVPGLAGTPHLTYEEVFKLESLPPRLLLLGGGPVGVELAQAFARLGSQVTLLEKEARLLTVADREAGETLTAQLRADGVQVETDVQLTEVTSDPTGIRLASPSGAFAGDVLLVATGRRPDLETLDLGRAGVDFDQGGIKVDDSLRTSQTHIYAAGDVTGSPQFTHVAGWQGYAAARNALFPGAVRGRVENVPWAVFTDPEIAQAGLTEAEARERGLDFTVHRLPMERVDRAQTIGQTAGFIKILVARSGRILGGTVVGPSAAELVNELSLAMAGGVKLGRLASTIHVYPTIGLGIQQLASDYALARAGEGIRGGIARALMGRQTRP